MKEVLAKCPKCGGMFLAGKYGPYCEGRCGFRIGKIFGEELSTAEAKKLISGEDVFLHRISRKTESEYEIIVKLADIREYPFTRKDGTAGVGFYPEVAFRFPDQEEREREAEKASSEDGLIALGEENLPF